MEAGAWFGEQCLFASEAVHDCALIAIDDSELALLPASCYHRICGKYPPIHEQHRAIASAIRVGELSMADLEHKPQAESSSTLPSWLPSWLQGVRNRVESTAPGRLSRFVLQQQSWRANRAKCSKVWHSRPDIV